MPFGVRPELEPAPEPMPFKVGPAPAPLGAYQEPEPAPFGAQSEPEPSIAASYPTMTSFPVAGLLSRYSVLDAAFPCCRDDAFWSGAGATSSPAMTSFPVAGFLSRYSVLDAVFPCCRDDTFWSGVGASAFRGMARATTAIMFIIYCLSFRLSRQMFTSCLSFRLSQGSTTATEILNSASALTVPANVVLRESELVLVLDCMFVAAI